MPDYGSQRRVRFEIEQWAAAYGDDCSVQRPWHGWIKKKAEITPQMLQDLQDANEKSKQITLQRRENCLIEGTLEWSLLRNMNTHDQAKID